MVVNPPNLQLRIVGQNHSTRTIGTPGLIWQRRFGPVIAGATLLYGALWSTPFTISSLLQVSALVVIACLLTISLNHIDVVIRMRRIKQADATPKSLETTTESPEQSGTSPVIRRLGVYLALLALGIGWLLLLNHMIIAFTFTATLVIGVVRLSDTQSPVLLSVFAAVAATLNTFLLVVIGTMANTAAPLGLLIIVGLPLGLLSAGTAAAFSIIETERRRTQGILLIPPSGGEIIAGRMSAILIGGAYLSCMILVGIGTLPFWLLLPVISFPLALKSLSSIARRNSNDPGHVGTRHNQLVGILVMFVGLSAFGILLARLLPF